MDTDKQYDEIVNMIEEIIDCNKKEQIEEKISDILDKLDDFYAYLYNEIEEKDSYIEDLENHIDYLKYEYRRF